MINIVNVLEGKLANVLSSSEKAELAGGHVLRTSTGGVGFFFFLNVKIKKLNKNKPKKKKKCVLSKKKCKLSKSSHPSYRGAHGGC